jgi:hypothetical protein
MLDEAFLTGAIPVNDLAEAKSLVRRVLKGATPAAV